MSISSFEHSSSVDLNALINPTPSASYLLRVSGDSMQDAGIFNDDILLVDRSLAFKDGDIVVAEINQEFTVKYLFTSPVVRLVPANDDYPTLYLNECDELNVFGVVATSIHRLRD